MAQAPLATEDDFRLVKAYILLPILLDVLERDIQALRTVRLRMAVIYIKALNDAQERITADIALLRKQMRRRGIKVYEQQRSAFGVEASYLCRGYRHELSMLWGLVKAELSQHLGGYLQRSLTIEDHS